jgi:hypothetical protein
MRKKISTPPLPPDPHKGRNLTFHHEGYKEPSAAEPQPK